MRISDWSSDVCSSDLLEAAGQVVGDATEMQAHGTAVDAIRVPRGYFDISYRENRPAPVNSPIYGGSGRVSGSEQEHALSGGLPVEQAIGFGGLLQRPAIGEQVVDVDLAVGDEGRAFRLPDRGEGPGADQRHLPAQQVRTDVERDVAALADEAGLAPGAHAAHRLAPRLGRRRGVDGGGGTEAMGRDAERTEERRAGQEGGRTGRAGG